MSTAMYESMSEVMNEAMGEGRGYERGWWARLCTRLAPGGDKGGKNTWKLLILFQHRPHEAARGLLVV